MILHRFQVLGTQKWISSRLGVSHWVVVKLIARVAIISRVTGVEQSTSKHTFMVAGKHQFLAGY